MSANITIGGRPIPLEDFEAAVNALINGIRSGATPEQIAEQIAPTVLPVVEDLATMFSPIPYSGDIIAFVAFVYSKSIPMKDLPQDEQNRIMDLRGNPTSG